MNQNSHEAVDTLIAENMSLQQRIKELEQESCTAQRMLQAVPVFFYVYDLVEQQMIFGNLGITELLGYADITELQQMGGDFLPQVMHPDDLAGFAAHAARFANLDDTATIEFEYRMQHADGSWRWFRSRDRVFNRTPDGNPRQIIGVVQDITTQKQSQTAMRLAQLALDYAGDSILWTDSNGSLIYVNHATCASLGYTADELLTMRLSDVVRTISPEYWTEIWELLRQQRSLTFEAQHWRKDGSTFPVEVSVSYITFDGNEYAYGFARDITERKQQERDLRTFKALVENAPDGIGVSDIRGTILYANPAYQSLTGYGPAMIGMNGLDLVATEDRERVVKILEALPVQRVVSVQIPLRRLDDTQVLVDIKSFVLETDDGQLQIIGFIRDISEQQRQEEELRLFKLIVEHASDGIDYTDGNGTIMFSNRAHRHLFGYDDEIIGMSITDTIAPESREILQRGMQEVITHGSWRGESLNRRKDGSIFPVELSVFAVHDNNGTLKAMVGIVRDISERKQAEQERAALLQQVIDAQRAAIRELSTPLIPISDTTVIMPLIGTIDSARTMQIMETLLEGVARNRATIAILDITGVQIVDTQVASALIRAAQAVKLLGAQVIITGIRPDVAQTLVHLGIDLSGILTRGTLQSAIEYALAQSRR